MPFDYAVPSVPDGSRIDYSDRLLAAGFVKYNIALFGLMPLTTVLTLYFRDNRF